MTTRTNHGVPIPLFREVKIEGFAELENYTFSSPEIEHLVKELYVVCFSFSRAPNGKFGEIIRGLEQLNKKIGTSRLRYAKPEHAEAIREFLKNISK